MSEDPRQPSRPAKLTAIGAALKEERMSLGMTQTQVADQFEISLKALRNLEQGKGSVSFAKILKILALFGKELRVGDLLMSPRKRSKTRPRRENILEILQLIKPILGKKFNIQSLALFGSCARDKAKNNSDIDIAVQFSKKPSFTLLGKLTVFLETLFEGNKVDLVEFDKMLPEVHKTAQEDFIYV